MVTSWNVNDCAARLVSQLRCVVLWQARKTYSDSAGCCCSVVSVSRACGELELGLVKACTRAIA